MKHTQRLLLFLVALTSGAMLTSCVVRGGAYLHTEPQLVAVGPGVWVVEDYDEPVFYNDGFYWRYYGGTWYRSRRHNNGWVVVHHQSLPHAIVRIERPRSYVHYRARPGVRVRRGAPNRGHQQPRRRNEKVKARGHHNPRPQVRDHRSNQGPKVRDHRDKKEPKVRDHRDKKPPKRRDYR